MSHGATTAERIKDIRRLKGEIGSADPDRLTQIRNELLGRKSGKLTQLLRSLKDLEQEERRAVGAEANRLREEIESAIEERQQALEAPQLGPSTDLTMPARETWVGTVNLITRVVDEVSEIFRELGFTRVVGREAETEDYNFTRLNIPLDHPAADMQDSFFLGRGIVLRTHTSPVQAHTMESHEPPIRILAPGRVFRRDPFDPSHSPVFEQIEGLAVDEGVSFVDFKAAIDFFARKFFSEDTPARFRPSFFPFTEPSAEVDVGCPICRGQGCSTCKSTGWLEIMGAGMVHPAVFENCGIDAEKYTGYAFGMGPERIAMARYGVPDIRMLFQNDMRFLSQFTGSR